MLKANDYLNIPGKKKPAFQPVLELIWKKYYCPTTLYCNTPFIDSSFK